MWEKTESFRLLIAIDLFWMQYPEQAEDKKTSFAIKKQGLSVSKNDV